MLEDDPDGAGDDALADAGDDAARHQEVGEQDEGEDSPGRRHLDPGRLLELQVGDCEDVEEGSQYDLHPL